MIQFKKQPTIDGSYKWDVRRVPTNPLENYVGTIVLKDGQTKLTLCGIANAVELAHTSAFMLELEAQYRANANSEQIEKELSPEPSHGNDCHSNGSCNHDELCRTRVLDSIPAVVTSDRADRVNVGT